MGSSAFFPNWEASASPALRLESIQAVAIPSTSSVGVVNFPTPATSFDATALHFSGATGAAGITTLVTGTPGLSIVVFGISINSNADGTTAPDAFAGSLFEEGNAADIYTFAASLQGPYFQDFDKPIVLAEGKDLVLQTYLGSTSASPINIVLVRYGIYKVAGK